MRANVCRDVRMRVEIGVRICADLRPKALMLECVVDGFPVVIHLGQRSFWTWACVSVEDVRICAGIVHVDNMRVCVRNVRVYLHHVPYFLRILLVSFDGFQLSSFNCMLRVCVNRFEVW